VRAQTTPSGEAYLADRMGSAEITPYSPVESGAFASLTLTYTAGYFGIDDTGSLKIVTRFASDMGKPQFTDARAANYLTVEASNGAVLDFRYDPKMNVRPWDKTLYVKVVRGFLREGDQIVVRYGDPRGGSPGMRMQTFCEATFEFKVLVDAFAAYKYVEIARSPTIAVVPGAPAVWKAILPTLRRAGEPFRLCLRAEDRWGNPTDRADRVLKLYASAPIANLPEGVHFSPGTFARVVEGLSAGEAGDLAVSVADALSGEVLCASNPLRIVTEAPLVPYWSDLHGQSEETIGTNCARDFFAFARDRAFLDACSHQGNDFQITTPFWNHLNELTAEFNQDGSFVAFPGYEWSGNTGLGGDRNVLYRKEGRPIHRSSHALIDDLSDVASDANSAGDLFEAIEREECIVFAHIGGRYADIKMTHDVRLERSVEVHSAWGTFEWLIEDALEQGYRVGIVSNSDGHKGRPGASYPGASLFGAYGGLTCILSQALTRDALLDALRRRHNYGTTGCRMLLDTNVRFANPATRFRDDPESGPTASEPAVDAMMGDILRYDGDEVTFGVEAIAGAPIERIEIRNGLDTIETVRPFASARGRRIRVVWEGSEYRGRGRETVWDGSAEVSGDRFARIAPINFYNLDKRLTQTAPSKVTWQALTTGGHGGFDAWLESGESGTLSLRTPLVNCDIPLASLDHNDRVFVAGGLRRQVRAFRLPDENPHRSLKIERTIPLRRDRDNALYVRVIMEDGHVAWSSPIYIFR
jgi:hypothetical protein